MITLTQQQLSAYHVQRYVGSVASQWDDFVEDSDNGTIFHRRKFLSYHPTERFRDHSLLFYRDNHLLAVLPAVEEQSSPHLNLVSHPGASFGGIVVHSPLSLLEAAGLVQSLKVYCRAAGVNRVVMKYVPRAYRARDSDNLEFALRSANQEVIKTELAHQVDLTAIASDQNHASAEFQRKVKRARRLGVTVERSEDFKAFYEILQENLAGKFSVRPTHSLAELLDLHNRFPEQISLLAAFLERRMIAGILLVACNRQAVLAFYISMRRELQQYRAVNLLCQEAFEWCAARGYRTFDFGTSTIAGVPNWGLVKFREAAGAVAALRETVALNC